MTIATKGNLLLTINPCQTSKMDRFAKIMNGLLLLSIFAKHSNSCLTEYYKMSLITICYDI